MTKSKNRKNKALKTIRQQELEKLERRRVGNNPEIKQLSESLERLKVQYEKYFLCLLYTSPSPRDS